jgi:hypothetical protein
MHTWKVLLILVLAVVCASLGMATIAVPLSYVGTMMWVWLGGLLTATVFACTLLALFMRYAGADLDIKPRGGHR